MKSKIDEIWGKMKKIKSKIKILLLILAIIIGLIMGTYFNYYVWRAEHPNAPIWTYILEGAK